ncbi:MAG: tRNA threonylcarbamoyladenosine dehydratase [Oscillospiraceae bacterium]|nr:tRNA threonylcarbamoyladenosine dehydratase [Oscillospiraceae bacterium]
MEEQFSRTALIIGDEGVERLQRARIAVFGIGGVGGYVCEGLARSGAGTLDLVDMDIVSTSNINRQIIALHSTIGRYKTEVMAERIADISPGARVNVYNTFVTPENIDTFPFEEYSYVVDAVDNVTAKLCIIERAAALGIPVISSMGAGNKTDGSRFRISDIYDTSVCPLARVMRRELKKRGIRSLKVVWSDEVPLSPIKTEYTEGGKPVPGSLAFCPSVAGLLIAGEVVKDIAYPASFKACF